MKNIISLSTILFFTITINAQLCKESNFISTNPDDPNGLTSNQVWDWRGDQNFTFYIKVPLSNTVSIYNIKSPFFKVNNLTQAPNVSDLQKQTQKDYEPGDGWELLFKNFGTSTNYNDAVAFPSFAMYNKYLSKVRFFIYITDFNLAYNEAAVSIRHSEYPNSNSTYLLQGINNPTRTLSHGIIKVKQSNPNEYINIGGHWFVGNYSVMYDPCACKYESDLFFDAELVETSNCTYTNSVTQKIDKLSSTTKIEESGLQSVINSLDFTTGFQALKTWDSYYSYLDGIQQNSEAHKITLAAIDPKKDLTGGLASILSMSGLAYGPELGFVLGVVKQFVSSTETKKTSAPITVFNGSNYTGSLYSTPRTYGTVQISTPGSDQSNVSPGSAPIYNELLGVFNLLDQPKLEWVTYKNSYSVSNNGKITANNVQSYFDLNGDTRTGLIYQTPIIMEFKSMNVPKFVINPASGLILKDIESCYVINSKNSTSYFASTAIMSHTATTNVQDLIGPVVIGGNKNSMSTLSLAERLAHSNFEIESWPNDPSTTADDSDMSKVVYRTPYMPYSWSNLHTFRLFKQNDNDFKIDFKVKVILSNPNGNKKDIILIYTFKTETEQSNLNNEDRTFTIKSVDSYGALINPPQVDDMRTWFVSDCDPSPWTNQIAVVTSIPNVLDLSNSTIDANTPMPLRAWSKIIIGTNTIIDPGVNLHLKAGREIEVDPTITLEPSAHLEVGYTKTEILNAPYSYPATKQELEQFCIGQQKIYNPKALNKTTPSVQHQNEESKPVQLDLVPNPSNQATQLYFKTVKDGLASIVLYDATGKKVKDLINDQEFRTGSYKVDISTADLTSGLYFIVFKLNNTTSTKKLIVERN